MNNEIFKDNSSYFRNALVRANFRDISKGIYEDDNFLYKFFSNLLLETNYELNDQDLYVAKEEEKNFDDIENDVEL